LVVRGEGIRASRRRGWGTVWNGGWMGARAAGWTRGVSRWGVVGWGV
jgi:hypothetical protein